MDSSDQVKIIMHWDIKDELEQEYFEFVVREFVPATTRMGLQTIGVWYTSYSRRNDPKIRLEALSEDLDTMRNILRSKEWSILHDKLLGYVENYGHKVVRFSGGFQI